VALHVAQEDASALCCGHEEGANKIDPWLHQAMGREGKLTALDVVHTKLLDQDKNIKLLICGYTCRETDTPKTTPHIIKHNLDKNDVVRFMNACMCVFFQC